MASECTCISAMGALASLKQLYISDNKVGVEAKQQLGEGERRRGREAHGHLGSRELVAVGVGLVRQFDALGGLECYSSCFQGFVEALFEAQVVVVRHGALLCCCRRDDNRRQRACRSKEHDSQDKKSGELSYIASVL